MGRQQISYRPHAREAAALLGALIRSARADRGWTAQELADRSGCSRRTVYQIEQGRPEVSLGHALNVATVVGVPLFTASPTELSRLSAAARDRVALLPRHVVSKREVFDDF